MPAPDRLRLNFDAFDAQIRKVADLIRDEPYLPDALVGLSRGGWIPTRLLSKYLGVNRIFNYGIIYTDKTRGTLSVYQTAKPTPEIKRILVVDDYIDSGRALKHAMGALTSKTCEVRSACIGYISKTVQKPHFSLGMIEELPHLPWE